MDCKIHHNWKSSITNTIFLKTVGVFLGLRLLLCVKLFFVLLPNYVARSSCLKTCNIRMCFFPITLCGRQLLWDHHATMLYYWHYNDLFFTFCRFCRFLLIFRLTGLSSPSWLCCTSNRHRKCYEMMPKEMDVFFFIFSALHK